MKKEVAVILTLISFVTVIAGIAFIIMCFFTDINDSLFLSATLVCIVISNVCNLIAKRINNKLKNNNNL